MLWLQVESRVETINFGERKTLDALKEMVPNGPDCSIEAVGFHYASTILHKVLPIYILARRPTSLSTLHRTTSCQLWPAVAEEAC